MDEDNVIVSVQSYGRKEDRYGVMRVKAHGGIVWVVLKINFRFKNRITDDVAPSYDSDYLSFVF